MFECGDYEALMKDIHQELSRVREETIEECIEAIQDFIKMRDKLNGKSKNGIYWYNEYEMRDLISSLQLLKNNKRR